MNLMPFDVNTTFVRIVHECQKKGELFAVYEFYSFLCKQIKVKVSNWSNTTFIDILRTIDEFVGTW